MDMITNVYSITNIKNGKRYIGVSQQVETRKRVHFWALKNGKHKNTKLTNAYEKYGVESFEFEIIETLENVTREFLLEREIYYINKYNSYKDGYNMSLGGDGSSLYVISDETREKYRKNMIGNKHFLGRKHTEETKRKIGDVHRGKAVSEATRKKLSEYSKKRKGELNPFYGKKHTEETKAKLRKTNGKKCRCIETGIVYDSVKECAEKMGIPKARTHINQVCLGNQKTSHGYTFEFVD